MAAERRRSAKAGEERPAAVSSRRPARAVSGWGLVCSKAVRRDSGPPLRRKRAAKTGVEASAVSGSWKKVAAARVDSPRSREERAIKASARMAGTFALEAR